MSSSTAEQKTLREIAKLESETAAIRQRLRHEGSVRHRMSAWSKILATLVGLPVALFGLLEGTSRFLEQRAEELEFQINREMIDLANQLLSEDPGKPETAALLLSSFEEHGVPVLVSRISFADSSLLPHLISALEIVASKSRVRREPEGVLEPILRQAELATREVERGLESEITTITNYIIVVGRIISLFDEPVRCQALDFLCELERRLSVEGITLSVDQKVEVRAHIHDAKRLLREQ